MATELEDLDIDAELLAQQEEEERLRQEELAAQAAAPAPVAGNGLLPYYGPKAGEPFARSFISGNTSQLGETIAAGRNDDEADARAYVQAARLQGRDEFQRLLKSGVPPADAFAQVAPNLFAGDNAGMARALRPTRRTAPVPPGGTASVRINKHPVTGEELSISIINPNGSAQRTTDIKKPVPQEPPDHKVAQENLRRQLDSDYKQFNADQAILRKPNEEPEIQAAAARRALQTQQHIKEAERKLQEGSTNWQSRATSAPVIPASPMSNTKSASDQMVAVVSPDGKRGSIPKSKLEAALKAGYKAR